MNQRCADVRIVQPFTATEPSDVLNT